MRLLYAWLFCACLVTPGGAAPVDANSRDFIASNLIAIFYHEIGHALIDIMRLPIYGQEEDAADVLSALLVHKSFTEEGALRVAKATAQGFLREHESLAASGDDVAYWDVHGPDLQRYFTFVCLFYGADPQARQAYADELNLPPFRQQTCADEYRQAARAWEPVMDRLTKKGHGRPIRFLADYRVDVFGHLAIDVIEEQVASMNSEMTLPDSLLVRVEACGTSNSFYDPDLREILVCTEYARSLSELAPR